ncbi:cysteine hydrolase family protein [Brevundimonas sp. SORGH_AS_0993]|uniref:cysteine hydrolase family protein n=1 Tax=Brevundimonas sp. SORGH_AS_0993 TaxID=3041794 RepID=UPI00278AC368|nr:cysteine hydrolase [Brevundimonas sp. SORGH_AS_0993]MDQ1154188.1 nicotinamidase-related amidase [Brevundimonas sp. SORGH_AS_0993]
MPSGLRARLGPTTAHLCVDMQRMFIEETDWHTPWAARILPIIAELCARRAAQTWFTRFIPADHPADADGAWKTYWRRWASMTRRAMSLELIDLAPTLRRFVPPARVVDKRVYSPWFETTLDAALHKHGIDTLVVTGAETDVCVLATVLGAVDRGYRVVVVTDAVCSSADGPHDNLLSLYSDRFSQQIETAECAEVLVAWPETGGWG